MKHFIELNKLQVKDSLPGATASYFETNNFTVAYTEMKAGAIVPIHEHPNEAVDIILDGILEMQVDDRSSLITTGMMSFVPSNMLHGAKAITDCKVVSIFYPKKTLM